MRMPRILLDNRTGRRCGTALAFKARPRLERLESRDVPSLVPLGPEFRVNTSTSSTSATSAHPELAFHPDCGFNAVWGELGLDGDGWGDFGRRFDNAGQPVTSVFPVNTITTGSQFVWRRSIAADATGAFVVVWYTNTTGAPRGIYGRRYDANGVALGQEQLLNALPHETGAVGEPTVAMNGAGRFVATWFRNNGATSHDVYARVFDASGTPLADEFQVNQFSTGSQYVSAAAMDAAGNFVVVWLDAQRFDIYGRRYSSDGTPLGSEFLINTHTAGDQKYPKVVMHSSGSFVVSWEGAGPGDDFGIFARRFDSAGSPLGPEFLVNASASGTQAGANLAMDPNGNFAIAWGTGSVLTLRGFSASGIAQGAELQVTTTAQLNGFLQPGLAMDSDGDVVVAWRYFPSSGPHQIWARRYAETGIAPSVQSVRINDGSAQRSRVMDLTVTFSAEVTFAGGNAANAFTLIRDGGKPVPFSATTNVVNGVTVVTLSNFTGASTQFGSLADGRYTLTVLASQVSANGQQMAGNHTFGSAQGLFRMFGDVNGDKQVDGADFGALSSTYGLFSSNPNFLWFLDVNGDGQVDGVDLSQFSGRYNTVLP